MQLGQVAAVHFQQAPSAGGPAISTNILVEFTCVASRAPASAHTVTLAWWPLRWLRAPVRAVRAAMMWAGLDLLDQGRLSMGFATCCSSQAMLQQGLIVVTFPAYLHPR